MTLLQPGTAVFALVLLSTIARRAATSVQGSGDIRERWPSRAFSPQLLTLCPNPLAMTR
jgi:hypothetical protein